jgi:hypothetical protein
MPGSFVTLCVLSGEILCVVKSPQKQKAGLPFVIPSLPLMHADLRGLSRFRFAKT